MHGGGVGPGKLGRGMAVHHVVVVGAGPAGIAAALSLRDHGVEPLVIERADRVAPSWRGRYDRLRLNTGRQFSHLPKRRYPRGTPTFPTRDQVVDYLERHARGLDIQFNTVVERIDRRPGGWRLRTSAGDIDAQHVVIAAGYEHTPYLPEWPGMQGFTGELRHSSQYRNPVPYHLNGVLVVGSGSSGMEIAHDLATGGAAKVWMSVRTPPNIMLRSGPGGLPGDVIATPLYHLPPRIADGIARRARPQPDAVICATGYVRGLEPIVGHLGVLDEHGAPRAVAGEAVAEGLRFLGYLSRPSLIGYVARRSRPMAKEIANALCQL
jgi:cation diffusion facilitator CzcD-associated flavoprotein CzcO